MPGVPGVSGMIWAEKGRFTPPWRFHRMLPRDEDEIGSAKSLQAKLAPRRQPGPTRRQFNPLRHPDLLEST